MLAPPLFDRYRLSLFLTLVTLLTSVYLLTFSGRIESGDTLSLFDAASSLAQYGDLLFDQSASVNEPPALGGDPTYALLSAEVEPLQPALAAGLFWIAERLPGVGLVHAVYTFNALIGGLAAGALFVYALALGYSERAAVLAALSFGLGTLVWPYSKSFFREPLALLLILLAALLAERWRAGRYRSPLLLALLAAALAGAYLSKEAVLFALPALAVIAAPPVVLSRRLRRALTALGALALILVAAGGVGIVLMASALDPRAYVLESVRAFRALEIAQTTLTAFHSYVFSIGGSVWATSPVTLLALPGLWLWYRQGRHRYAVAVPLLLLGFAVSYALLRGIHWFGGLSWPPRFLVPVVPFLILGALPVFDRLTRRPPLRSLIGVVVVLLLFSLWVQLSGVLLPWDVYPGALPPEAGGLIEWGGGLNTLAYLRWVVLPPLWLRLPLDLAWLRADAVGWPIMFGALIVVCLLRLVHLWRRPGLAPARRGLAWLAALPLGLLLAWYIGLRLIYFDPLYRPASADALEALLPEIQRQGRPGDVLLLANDNYQSFFLNYGKFHWPRLISLPDQPGEQPSPEQPALVRSDNPDALLVKLTIPLIHNLAAQRDRLWLLADSGPWIAWSVRPVERFMAAHYYPIREFSTDPTVRLIEYGTDSAPEPYSFKGPEHLSDLLFGHEFLLVGYSMVRTNVMAPGDVLPLSLAWQAEQTPAHDYVVAWFLVDAAGNPIAQGADSPPGGGFEPTTRWPPNRLVWDNRALIIPADAQPGLYRLWVRVYYWEGGQLRLLPVTGRDAWDSSTGVLPAQIIVGETADGFPVRSDTGL